MLQCLSLVQEDQPWWRRLLTRQFPKGPSVTPWNRRFKQQRSLVKKLLLSEHQEDPERGYNCNIIDNLRGGSPGLRTNSKSRSQSLEKEWRCSQSKILELQSDISSQWWFGAMSFSPYNAEGHYQMNRYLDFLLDRPQVVKMSSQEPHRAAASIPNSAVSTYNCACTNDNSIISKYVDANPILGLLRDKPPYRKEKLLCFLEFIN